MKLKQQHIEDYLPEDYYNVSGEDITSITGILWSEKVLLSGNHLRGEE